MINNCMLNLTILFRHWIVFILCSTNNIDHNSPQSIASTIVSTGLVFQKKSHKFQAVIIPLLLRDDKHSRRRGIIITVNILLKFQCLNNGFNFLEFIWNWLNNNDSLNMELFYDDDLHLIRKGNKLLAKEIINFCYHSKYTMAYSKPSYRDTTSFHLITQIFYLFLLKTPLLILLTLYNSRSSLVTLIFQLLIRSFLPSLFLNPIKISLH